ncbi:MAG: hypothetical protein ACE5IO_02200 [Thermoplasmata archaeon]
MRTIKKNRYLYFWWYEQIEGRSIQKYAYMGRAEDPVARNKGNRMAYKYYLKSREMLDELVEAACISYTPSIHK